LSNMESTYHSAIIIIKNNSLWTAVSATVFCDKNDQCMIMFVKAVQKIVCTRITSLCLAPGIRFVIICLKSFPVLKKREHILSGHSIFMLGNKAMFTDNLISPPPPPATYYFVLIFYPLNSSMCINLNMATFNVKFQ
ncbi:unnamed protein product, partial [Meganyctiphanes norvegica]